MISISYVCDYKDANDYLETPIDDVFIWENDDDKEESERQ
jgi:hypothetical protein